MAKEPAKRYQTAEAMANDLRRWLAGQPITARPVGRVERGWRWCRRNPVVASLATSVALALISGTVVSSYFAIRESAERERADAKAAEAIAERERAEEGFREAREAVDKYFTQVSESTLLKVPGLQPLRKELLESALKHYQKFIGRYGNDPKVQAEMAKTYIRVGAITSLIVSEERSLANFKKAIEIYEKLVHESPVNIDFQARLANAYNRLGNSQTATGRPAEAEASYRKVIGICEGLARESPTAVNYRDSLAATYIGLGNLQRNTGRSAEAETSYQRAIEVCEKLVRDQPTLAGYQDSLARA